MSESVNRARSQTLNQESFCEFFPDADEERSRVQDLPF